MKIILLLLKMLIYGCLVFVCFSNIYIIGDQIFDNFNINMVINLLIINTGVMSGFSKNWILSLCFFLISTLFFFNFTYTVVGYLGGLGLKEFMK